MCPELTVGGTPCLEFSRLQLAVHPASCYPENVIHLVGNGVQVFISIGQMQSALGGGVTQEETEFHLQRTSEYKSGFIGNDYKKVGYLGKEVYNTSACSLVKEF